MKLPASPLELYVQIYCKRKKLRNIDQCNIVDEATKSWATLSKTEKLLFTDKYKEFQKKYRNKLATHLKDVHPYLKKKRCKGDAKKKSTEEKNESEFSKHKIMSKYLYKFEIGIPTKEVTFEIKVASTIKRQIHILSYEEGNKETERTVTTPENDVIDNTLTLDNCVQNGNRTVDDHTENISPPDPPKLKLGKELYYMIQEKYNNGTELWSALSTDRKRKYHRALQKIKCNYIKNFIAYLESLEPEQLFNYYNKYCFE